MSRTRPERSARLSSQEKSNLERDNSSSQPSDTHDRKRPVSERKIRANRENSLKSTGPKTERGKRTVSRNAIKHGFLAREVVITDGYGEESLEEYHALLDGLFTSYEPVDIVEENLVHIIGASLWRKARVIRAENGEIRRQLDTVDMDRALRNLDKGNFDLAVMSEMELRLFSVDNPSDQKVPRRDRWSAMQNAQTNLRENAPGRAHLATLLMVAKSEIQNDGYISEQVRQDIFLAFCFWDLILARACFSAAPPPARTEDQPSEKVDDQQAEAKRVGLIALIEERLERLFSFEEYALEREKLALEADARRFSLPSAEATEKILRYEAHLDRQLYRAMDQLERLQRQRQGENVPPPVNVNLGRRG